VSAFAKNRRILVSAAVGQVVELGVQVGERDADGRTGHGELLRGKRMDAVGIRGPGAAADGIEELDVLNAYGDIVVDAFLHVAQGISAREELHAEEWG
jgi:hypothetical protein